MSALSLEFETAGQAPAGLYKLSDLPVGQEAVVVSLAENFAQKTRFLELGFTPGAAVFVVRRALFGDPIEIDVRGIRYGLRRAEAQNIQVRIS